MRIVVHIGMEQWGSARIQSILDTNREALAAERVLVPRSPGRQNHTRLYMAVSDPGHIDSLRFNRGFATTAAQERLQSEVAAGLSREIEAARPGTLILSANQLGTQLTTPSELGRLKEFLSRFSNEITVVAHVDEQAAALARHFANAVAEGRAAPIERELDLAAAESWWDASLALRPKDEPEKGLFADIQAPPHWLDYARLVQEWETVFGAGNVALRRFDLDKLAGDGVAEEIAAAFDVPRPGSVSTVTPPRPPSSEDLARGVAYNRLLLRLIAARSLIVPRQTWRRLIADIAVGVGDPIEPRRLSRISKRFAADNATLRASHPGLGPKGLRAGRALAEQDPPAFTKGFRASQYLLADLGRIRRAHRDEQKARADDLADLACERRAEPLPPPAPAAANRGLPAAPPLSDAARAIMPPLAIQKYEGLRTSFLRPHNLLGRVNEEEMAAAFSPVPPRHLPKGSSGNVIVACMKNEAPYILEWIAYHRCIGVDNFLIYTNDCEDGTDRILDRLAALKYVKHRRNDDWKGKSPQQFALNQALKERVVKQAEWLIHIDVDEFINVRCGNGTLGEFFDRVPDATNVAMTWRLFGHNGVTRFEDRFVIEQFDTCAPKYCPKPHTVWGFKTMFRNIGAYAKLSCHRPNKLDDALRDRVKWVNGSGRDMTSEAIRNGWRSSRRSIGYDLIQLNHYALRSAESFLIKRQRGRALHVDRAIGLNYWIRMDWSGHRDITIKRNVPRLRAEVDRLKSDPELRLLHQQAVDWHREKAEELRNNPEFAELYEATLNLQLTETERVAYALALDMES